MVVQKYLQTPIPLSTEHTDGLQAKHFSFQVAFFEDISSVFTDSQTPDKRWEALE